MGGPKGGGPETKKKWWLRRVGRPKFRAVFSFSRHNFHSFFLLLGVFSWEFWWCLQSSTRRTPKEMEERKKNVAEEGKKERFFWAALGEVVRVKAVGRRREETEKKDLKLVPLTRDGSTN